MKSWEIEKMVHDEAYSDGFSNGFSDGFNDGTEKMNQLIIHLTDSGRMDDIIKVARDKAYREELFTEFNL